MILATTGTKVLANDSMPTSLRILASCTTQRVVKIKVCPQLLDPSLVKWSAELYSPD